MKKIRCIVEKTSTGYSAYTEDLAICSVGDSLHELKSNMREAYAFYQEDLAEAEAFEIELILDIRQLFEYFPTVNKSTFAKYINMNRSLLSQYVNGLKQPSEEASFRIIDGLYRLGKEYTSVMS